MIDACVFHNAIIENQISDTESVKSRMNSSAYSTTERLKAPTRAKSIV